MKEVVIVIGSPRKEGNTQVLAREAARGLADSGAVSRLYFLNDLNISGCQACYYCKMKGVTRCRLIDDMGMLYEAIDGAAGLIVAAPIYFGGVSGQTKVWVDRLFPYIDVNLRPLLPAGKTASFIFTQNQPDEKLFTGHIRSLTSMFGYMGFRVKDTLVAGDLDKGRKPMVTEDDTVMAKAYALGRGLLAE